MTRAPTVQHGNAYNIFILVLTVQSLLIMLLLLLPLSEPTLNTLRVFDNIVCGIFLVDVAINVARSKPRRQYFIYERGWLDLLGSIPSLGFFQLTALLRLARLSRLARIARLMSGQNRRELVNDVVHNRGQYALFITFLAGFLVLSVSTVLVIQFESRSPDANIKTGGDALWWGFTTITTVGYGDRFPVTFFGRATALFVMFAGVGIIGSLASILASYLVPSADETAAAAAEAAAAQGDGPAPSAGLATTTIETELAQIRTELAAMRELLAERS
ncbi:MAG TPA: ion transporter [Candidatus Limnocylindrales bacterium]|nr:ion transporter [Candidatus Limnocylindrales bacterium]